MTDHCANDIVDSRPRMLLPLVVFGAACFLFAGAVKFHVKGGDIWFARPMGAPATCLLIGFVGFLAARWFFGARPAGLPTKFLAALVVVLPLMGLFGVIQAAMQSGGSDSTPLGGTLGAMLAGPSAFGSLGTTAAGVLFLAMSLFGGYLARRITRQEAGPQRDDPYTLLRAMNAKRAGAPGGGVAVADDEPAADAQDADAAPLFPADAEVAPEPAGAGVLEDARPIIALGGGGGDDDEREDDPRGFVAIEDEVAEMAEPTPPRAPLLSGIVEADDDEDTNAEVDDDDNNRVFTPLFSRTSRDDEDDSDTGLALDLDDEPAGYAESDGDGPIIARPPEVEPDEDAGSEPDLDDATIDDGEVEASIPAPDSTDAPAPITPEWLAAPAEFHVPRGIERAEATADSLFDVLDVATNRDDDAAQASAPPPPERPRFRVKADYVRRDREEEAPTDFAAAPSEEASAEVAARPEVTLAPEAPAEIAIPEEETPPPVESRAEPTAPAPHEPSEAAAEAQLEFPVDPPPEPATRDDAAPAPRPRRRMRSARKDWASWDEAAPEKDRPRLRLVRADEPETLQTEITPEETPPKDDPYDRAVALVVQEDRCSVSLLQRNLGVTFGEATALIDRMYQQGVVGPYQTTGRRDVLLGKKGAAAEDGA